MSDKPLFDVVRAILVKRTGSGLTTEEVQQIKAVLTEVVAPLAADPSGDPNDALLAVELERDERYVRHAYKDSRGYWTIGIGRLIDKALGGGLTREEALYLKRNDIVRFKAELDRAAPWWRQLDPVRQRAVQNMTFNLGSGWITPGHAKAWPNTVALLKSGRFREAADAIRANKVWVGQVGDRALRIAKQIETGQ